MRDRVVLYLEKRVSGLSSSVNSAAKDVLGATATFTDPRALGSSLNKYFQDELDKLRSELAIVTALLQIAKRHKPGAGRRAMRADCQECKCAYPCQTRLDLEQILLR